ncbi:16S rRNA (guanine(527)-N(7))-methyltransferase RsmG [Capnocytophaga sp. G2]|uniref:16S rRNA (guanine(527)-N(7))-methyltransferase RsmG n=1 Tax=Capnocytophaga sp. G2 TaxID=3110695 RepID=UPI002B47D0FB|nr:16S rRNA (guanine(527)-N(7))-methyltransferase RsmG [Capnocytophaga sp. G2]MEB3004499.1 16S rRNA (guanine(527)-N(7))-methyltransferase RsmG [Capnocytophaga sp. G2]
MELLLKYFPELTPKQIAQYTEAISLYKDWNTRINVISRKDMEHFVLHHLLHSLGIAKICSFESGIKVLDVGTGGGFPGIPLAILYPEVSFHLVDSIGKKIKVVQEVANALSLTNVTYQQVRVETLEGQYDYIVSRAVTQMDDFYKLTKHLLKPVTNKGDKRGILYLKGGDLTEELSAFPSAAVYNLSDVFEEDFFETKKVVYL